MTKFRKKPVVVDAILWTGDNLREVISFTDGPPETRTMHAGMKWDEYEDLVRRDGFKIFTLEGKMNVSVGDWIIRGVQGEYYPCKPDIFEATYEPASAPTQAEAREAGIRACIAIVEGRAKEYEALLDKGKGQHGQPGYVRDSTWDSWQGHHSEASQTVTLLRALLTEGEAAK